VNALVLWSASLLGLVIVWLVCAWLARKLFDANIGLHSSAAVWVLGVAIPLLAMYAVISSVRWVKAWKDCRHLLRADIAEALVIEEHYTFTAAKRFQEPEHGGLIYFLRTEEGEVLTLFDHESQDLGIQGGDPLSSSFQPRTDLVMVRAPLTAFVLSKTFSGEQLETGDPEELAADPRQWPESEALCSIPWDELEAKLGSRAEGKGAGATNLT